MSTTATGASEKNCRLATGDQITVNELLGRYKAVKRVPVPVEVKIDTINAKTASARVKWSTVNYERVEAVKFVSNALVNYNEHNDQIDSIIELPGTTELNNELSSVTSASSQYRICISKSNGKESKNESSSGQRLDIWIEDQNTLFASIDVDTAKHGAICLNPRLANFAFSPNETQFVYVADVKAPKTESYFKDANLFKEDKKEDAKPSEPAKGAEFEYKQDWGEQFDGLRHTVVCVLTLKPELKVKIIDLPDRSLGQPFWIDERTLGFLAYQETPKRLGLVFCMNRVAHLYKCELAASDQEKDNFKVVRGENDDLHLANVQINLQRDKVAWFENGAGGAHAQATRVMLWDLKADAISTVFEQYETQQPIFKSLFVIDVSPNYWALNGEHLVLSTLSHSRMRLFTLNVRTKMVRPIKVGLESGSAEVLNLKNNLLAIVASSPNVQPVVMLGVLDFKSDQPVKFKQLRTERKNRLDEITYRIIKQNEHNELEQLETILIGPTERFDKPTPVIVIPHGGPHGACVASYMKEVTFLVRLGFKVALVNYRGSLGITHEYVNQLCGHVGDLDVKDVIAVINNLIELNLVDKDNIHLRGGSHGGFLVTHLIGQYPDMFASCIALNPVTDMSKMFTITDIPDWDLIEALGIKVETYQALNDWKEENNLVKQLNCLIDVGPLAVLQPMFDKSPMKHVNKVKTPVLMMLGKNDLRVPHYQGLSFVNALKSRGVATKCYIYPDNHQIGKPAHDGDCSINCARWILDHVKH